MKTEHATAEHAEKHLATVAQEHANGERAKALGLPDDPRVAILDLADRVVAIEKRLNALQNATAHITSIPGIPR